MGLIKNKQPRSFLLRNLLLLFLLSPCLMASGREGPSAAAPADDSVYVFRFLPANGMFYIPLKGNDVLLQDLCRLVESRRAAIEAGVMPVRVESYCASLPTEKGNLDTAFVRASRVKSELILRQGLKRRTL